MNVELEWGENGDVDVYLEAESRNQGAGGLVSPQERRRVEAYHLL